MSIEKWSDEEYFSKSEYMSVSLFKRFQKCELMGLAGFDDGEKSKDMMIGSYVDAYVSGTLDKFKEDNPDVFSTRGASKGELKAEYKLADQICDYITKDKVFSQFMSGEKQVVMTGFICEVPFKIKIDSYSKGIAINDLKVMRSVTDNLGNFKDFITPWGYDVQMACYQEIVYQNTGEKLPVYICAVTKENPINSVIVNIPQVYLDVALYKVQEQIQHFYDVLKGTVEAVGCGTCSVCVKSRTETPIISFEELIGDI